MSKSSNTNVHRKNAQGHFSQSQKRDELLKDEREMARKVESDKIARLRALRLEKESASKSPNDGNNEN